MTTLSQTNNNNNNNKAWQKPRPSPATYTDRAGMQVTFDYNIIWRSENEIRLLGWTDSFEHATTKARDFAREAAQTYNQLRNLASNLHHPHAAQIIEAVSPSEVDQVASLAVAGKPLMRIEIERPAVLGLLWNSPRKTIGSIQVVAIVHIDDFNSKQFFASALLPRLPQPSPTQPLASALEVETSTVVAVSADASGTSGAPLGV